MAPTLLSSHDSPHRRRPGASYSKNFPDVPGKPGQTLTVHIPAAYADGAQGEHRLRGGA
jgi:hypothetical protein